MESGTKRNELFDQGSRVVLFLTTDFSVLFHLGHVKRPSILRLFHSLFSLWFGNHSSFQYPPSSPFSNHQRWRNNGFLLQNRSRRFLCGLHLLLHLFEHLHKATVVLERVGLRRDDRLRHGRLGIVLRGIRFVRRRPMISTAFSASVPVPASIPTTATSSIPGTRPSSWSRSRSVPSRILPRSISVPVPIFVSVWGPRSFVRSTRRRFRSTASSSTSVLWRIVSGSSTASIVRGWRWTPRRHSVFVPVIRRVTRAIHRRRRRGRRWVCIGLGAAFVPLWIHCCACVPLRPGWIDRWTPIRIETAFYEYTGHFFLPRLYLTRFYFYYFLFFFFLMYAGCKRQADL